MLIHIKLEHLIDGRKGKCEDCPIALAMMEQLGIHYVSVSKESIHISKTGYRDITIIKPVPLHVIAFITKFDLSFYTFEQGPISLEIPVPPEFVP